MSTIKNFKTSNNGCNCFHVEFFDSADEVVNTCRVRERTSDLFYDMKTHKIREEWHGVKSYDEALELMRTGYQPTVDSMKGVFSATIYGEARRFCFQNGVYGFAPIVPLALKGVPNSMMSMQMKPMKAKVIDVYYNMTVSCNNSSEEMIRAGQTLLGALIELEQQGYRFNLYAVQAYANNCDADVMVVRMKTSTQPLDLKRVSFPMTHPGFFRVIGFDWYSKMPGGKYRTSYGKPLSSVVSEESQKIIFSEMFGKNAVVFSAQTILKKKTGEIKEAIGNAECKG